MNLRGTRVLVMGLGVHGGGLGVARWLLRQGAHLTVTDTASAAALAASVAALNTTAAELATRVAYTLGEHRAEDIAASEMVVVNPAVRPDSPWLALARQHGAAIETEMTLFFRACPGPILGVTGTKGKTTTALMLAAMLRERFPDTLAAGNLRVSALEALPQLTPQTPVVLELSSFQLERLGAVGLSPHYSLLTNLSGDHLNWHGSMDAYAAAKRQIYWHQPADGLLALNVSDAGLAAWLSFYDGQQGRGGRRIEVITGDDYAAARTQHPDPRLLRRVPTTVRRQGEAIVWDDPAGLVGPRSAVLFHTHDLRLPGAHNLANAMLAAALATSFGVDPPAIAAALRGFGGVEHRLELVAEQGGVRYVNDTTATNPAGALAALRALEGPLVLIAGGADKHLAFTELGAAIAGRVKALVLLEGTATARLRAAVEQAHQEQLVIQGPFGDFAAAIGAARALARPGDTILLSPGCASFGMFHNEFHRGEEFRRIVLA